MDADQEEITNNIRIKRHKMTKNIYSICGLLLICISIFLQEYGEFQIVVFTIGFFLFLENLLGVIFLLTGVVIEECSQQKLVLSSQGDPNDYIRQWLLEQQANNDYQNALALQEAQNRISVESQNRSQLDQVYGNLCTICNEDINPKDKAVPLPCMHIFHPDCIRKWIKIKQLCPNCKQPIRPGVENELAE